VFSLVLLATLTANAGVSLAIPGFQLVDLDEKHGPFLENSLAQQLVRQGLQVTTSTQLQAMLGVERQKQLLGCSEDGSCMVELANALGVDGLLLGTIARLADGSVQVNVRVIAASTAKLLAQWTARVASEEALLKAFAEEAPRLAADIQGTVRPSPGPSKAWAILPGGLALGLGVAGAVTLGIAEGRVQQLRSGPALESNVQVFATETKGLQTAGAVLVISAGVSAGLAGALALFGSSNPVQPVAYVTPSGGGLGVCGVFP